MNEVEVRDKIRKFEDRLDAAGVGSQAENYVRLHPEGSRPSVIMDGFFTLDDLKNIVAAWESL